LISWFLLKISAEIYAQNFLQKIKKQVEAV
jgi:hypothetical protein